MLKKRIIVAAIGGMLMSGTVLAQIATDGSVGAAQALIGPAFTIPETFGTVSGGNLFHSFSTFNIQAGESAAFTTTSALNNVIVRVTGGNPSLINGQLSLSPAIGTPDFYFINPSGVMFGAGASLNIPGAFHVGTADYVAFADGNFNVDLGQGSTLSAASPEAFGFLGGSAAVLSVSNTTLSTTSPTGTIDLQGGTVNINASTLNTREGAIRITAAGTAPAEIQFGVTVPAGGTINIVNAILSSEASAGTDTGDVLISGENVSLLNTSLESFSYDVGNAGDITLLSEILSMQSSSAASLAYASGAPGYISISATDKADIDASGLWTWASNMLPGGIGLSGGEFILTGQTLATPGEGDMVVNVKSISLYDHSAFDAVTTRAGNAGDVIVNADSIYLNDAYLNTSTIVGSGDAGNIIVTTDLLTMDSVARILSNSYGLGDAGSITINAGNIVINSGEVIAEAATTIPDGGIYQSLSGQTGNVTVTADHLSISNNGLIGIRSLVSVADPAAVTPTLLSVIANNIDLSSGGSITSQAVGNIDASNIDIAFANALILTDSSIASTSFDGDAGTVTIRGGDVISLDNSIVSTSVTGLIGGTTAGNINVTADTLVLNTGFIQANAAALNAAGGDVVVNVNSVIPSMQMLWVGGAAPFLFQPGISGFNVIQAVSPAGVSGEVNVSAPVVDLSAGLTGLADRSVRADALGRSPCQVNNGSSLAPVGRGGLPPSAADLVSVRSNDFHSESHEYAALAHEAIAQSQCVRL